MPADRVARLPEDICAPDATRFALVQALRTTILGLQPGITEEVKYGGIMFAADKPFCGVFSYTKHVSLEFGAGASFADVYQVLEGDGKLRRHIKLFSEQDLAAKHVPAYLDLALGKSKT